MQHKTLYDKIWDSHVVVPGGTAPPIIYIDLHLIHEVTSPQAFATLRELGLRVRRPDLTIATADHSTPTTTDRLVVDSIAEHQIQELEKNCGEFGISYFGPRTEKQGIVHVIGPELGLTRPGMTIVCGDSHTSTHGAFGALAFGIGTTEVSHVLATQCLLQRKSRNFRIDVRGRLSEGVTAKDIILSIISKTGVGGGSGHVIEYTGAAIKNMDMEARMTICNMSIEAGARAGLIAPDETTFDYIARTPFAAVADDWDAELKKWRRLTSDSDARYDTQLSIDAIEIEPMISFGTNPAMNIPVTGFVPDPAAAKDTAARSELQKAIEYMELKPGQSLLGQAIDVAFIGSCTNSRISDLRAAAQVLRGRKVHPSVRTIIVPGSRAVKRNAEAEGLDRVFKAAGAEWREPGCSMCIAMNGDKLEPGERGISTSNRNFEGRQGPGSRTFLASPLTAAASAVAGVVADPRKMAAHA